MHSRHGQNEHHQIIPMAVVESKDNIDESLGTIEIEIEIFTKYNKNVEIWTVDKRNGNKKCVVDDYLMKTAKQLRLSPNDNDKTDIIFYSGEIPQEVSLHEFTWLEMMTNDRSTSNDSNSTFV